MIDRARVKISRNSFLQPTQKNGDDDDDARLKLHKVMYSMGLDLQYCSTSSPWTTGLFAVSRGFELRFAVFGRVYPVR